MDITISPGKLCGTVKAIPSKSQAHRLLICAAFSKNPTFLECPQSSEDIDATARCLSALGAGIRRTEDGFHIDPIVALPDKALLDCGESGSTLRFLLPIVCALGVSTTFVMHGRLPDRPLSPLWEELERMGCSLSRPTKNNLLTDGKLQAGTYEIRGDISSQFITGLLFACSLMEKGSQIKVIGELESRPYVEMTQQALNAFGVCTDNFCIPGGQIYISPGHIKVEGDWSNGAFFMVAQALGNPIQVTNLSSHSKQGDKAIADFLDRSSVFGEFHAANTPDLVPILSILLAANDGGIINGIARLRLKESDRVKSVCEMLNAFGVKAEATNNTMQVYPGKFHSGTVDAAGDHRIAMAAAIAATIADGPVTILGAECVAKSYPAFWQEYEKLGGKYEQYLR